MTVQYSPKSTTQVWAVEPKIPSTPRRPFYVLHNRKGEKLVLQGKLYKNIYETINRNDKNRIFSLIPTNVATM